MRYIKDFKKVVTGFVEVEAKDEQEAERLFNDGEFDEFDHKSNYEFGEWKKD